MLNSALSLYKLFRELHLKCNFLVYKTGSTCEHMYLCICKVNLQMIANEGEPNSVV